MTKGRLEAFSDAVIAIVITIMVLELRVPEGSTLQSLRPVVPKFLAYALSFILLSIYWNNHHHLLQAVERVSGSVLWANFHLLFWLSLVPFVTGWLGEAGIVTYPVAVYGIVLTAAGIAYFILVRTLISIHGADSSLAEAIGNDLKGKLSIGLYAVALVFSVFLPAISLLLYVVVVAMWLIPDRRFERRG